jgi:hypothetical protein
MTLVQVEKYTLLPHRLSSVSTPAFGVTTTNLSPSSTPTPETTTSSSPTTTPADFSSSTALQTPTSIVAPAISSISTASSITAPNSSPIVGLPGSASSVTPPNASVPNSSTPTSSGVTPPGSSPGTGTGVTPPASEGVTFTPQGYYNVKGDCVSSKTRNECDTTKDLEDKAAKLENDIENGVGKADEKRLELETIRADLNLRELYGNDRVADGHLERLVKSELFNDPDFNNGMRIHMLQTMSWAAPII